MKEPLAYLNGQLVPASAATISPVDAGFVLGAAVAEQLRTFGGRIFHLDDHLARLARSLAVVGVGVSMPPASLGEMAVELAARNRALLHPDDDVGVAIIVTPGLYAGYGALGTSSPTVCLHTYPLPFDRWADKYRTGQALVTTDVRQVPPDCWPAELKCRSRMHYFLADRKAAALDPGARAILLDHEDHVTEASTANVVIYRRDEGLVSPPHERVLPGISLAVIDRLAGELGIPIVYRDLAPSELASADELLLTSTPFCLLPATRLNGQPVGDGHPGPIFAQLLDAFSRAAGIDIAAQAQRFATR
jgi:branched-chain amino acid aminotransferase